MLFVDLEESLQGPLAYFTGVRQRHAESSYQNFANVHTFLFNLKVISRTESYSKLCQSACLSLKEANQVSSLPAKRSSWLWKASSEASAERSPRSSVQRPLLLASTLGRVGTRPLVRVHLNLKLTNFNNRRLKRRRLKIGSDQKNPS